MLVSYIYKMHTHIYTLFIESGNIKQRNGKAFLIKSFLKIW